MIFKPGHSNPMQAPYSGEEIDSLIIENSLEIKFSAELYSGPEGNSRPKKIAFNKCRVRTCFIQAGL